jgi:long-chain fatty acid transport protein
VPGALGGGSSHSDFESRFEFPTIVGMGYGYEVTPNLRLELDVEWLEFSRFDSLPLDTGGNPFFPSLEIEQDWQDTFTIGIAGDWRFAPNWILRAGYQFYESPVPDWTFSPSIPDANQHVFTVGLGYRIKQHSFEVAYGADFYDHRDIDRNQNAAFTGDYDITVHMIAVGYRFAF